MAKSPAQKKYVVNYFRKNDLKKAEVSGNLIELRSVEVEASSPEEATTKASTPARVVTAANTRARGGKSKAPKFVTVSEAKVLTTLDGYIDGTKTVHEVNLELGLLGNLVPPTKKEFKGGYKLAKQEADPDGGQLIGYEGTNVEIDPLEPKDADVAQLTEADVQNAVDGIAPNPFAPEPVEEPLKLTRTDALAEKLLGDDDEVTNDEPVISNEATVVAETAIETDAEPTEEELAQKAEAERQEAIVKIDEQIDVLNVKIERYENALRYQESLAQVALENYAIFAVEMEQFENRLSLRPAALDRLEQAYGALPAAVKEDDSFEEVISDLKARVGVQNFYDALRARDIERYRNQLDEAITTVQGLAFLRAELTGVPYVDPFEEEEEEEEEVETEPEEVSYDTLHPVWHVFFLIIALVALADPTHLVNGPASSIGLRLFIGGVLVLIGVALANSFNERNATDDAAVEPSCDCGDC